MSVLSDRAIKRRLLLKHGDPQRLVIEPFLARTKEEGRPSFGLQPTGYDIRLGSHFVVFDERLHPGRVLDPLEPSSVPGWQIEADAIILPAHGFALAETLERVEMPLDCVGEVSGKSTWARVGLCINATKFEPGWRGRVTLELANLTPLPLRVTARVGVAQILFHAADELCERGYDGVYQDQGGLTLPRV